MRKRPSPPAELPRPIGESPAIGRPINQTTETSVDLPTPRRKGGRPPRPSRCVVQLRQKSGGKTGSSFSMTVDLPFIAAMSMLQQLFGPVRKKFSRATDDFRWRISTTLPADHPETVKGREHV